MKSTYEIVTETATKHMGDRKLVLWGKDEAVFQALMKSEIKSLNIVVVENDQADSLDDFRDKSKGFYIIIGKRNRTQYNKNILEQFGYREVYDYMFVHGIERFVTQEMYVNVKETDTMNILGAASLGRMPFVLPHLQMLQDKHPDKLIRFYLFYHASAVPETELAFQRIARYAKAYKNIELHGVPVGEEDEELQELLTKYIGLSSHLKQTNFNVFGAPYYTLLAHKYLPKTLDRILTIDIGDTVINDSLIPFYYEDFEGKSMILTIGRDTNLRDDKGRLRPFTQQDCQNHTYLKRIANESFNGGVKLINLEKWRKLNYTISDYIAFAKKVQDKYHLGGDLLYDQGLFGLLFLEDIKFYKMKEFDDERFMPFNHVAYLYINPDGSMRNMYYSPAIVHFCGYNNVKPWLVKYPQKLKLYQDGTSVVQGTKNADVYYLQWYDAALKAEQIIEKVDSEYLPENVLDICNIKRLDEYLHYLEALSNKYLICISIKDCAGGGLPDAMASKLTKIGIADLRQEGRWSYVFAQVKGKIILNKLDGFETVTKESVFYENHTIELSSVPYTKGSHVKIAIDKVDYAVNCRGLNIVVFDLDKGRLIDTVGFDTVFANNPCYRKSDLYYAVKGLSSEPQTLNEIISLISERSYENVINECNAIADRVETHVDAIENSDQNG